MQDKETQAQQVQETTGLEKVNLGFIALDKYVEEHILRPDETVMRGRDFVFWGKRNDYPEYIYSLYREAGTLQTIIDGCVDYAVGDDIVCNALVDGKYMDTKQHTIRDLAQAWFKDWFMYKGAALCVIRNNAGGIAEVVHTPFLRLRSDKDNEAFFYSEDWKRRFGKTNDLKYPKFVKVFEGEAHASSILYTKGPCITTYPECYVPVKAAEIERCIDDYQINEIHNGFMASFLINFNNGQPTDAMRKEIERNMNEKFSGAKNAGRIGYSFNDGKDKMAIIQKIDVTDFADKYNATSKNYRQKLFAAYRANPNIFGIPTENNGFSDEDYQKSFKLFNRTMIQPAQKLFIETMQKIYDANVKIKPFSLETVGENTEQSTTGNTGIDNNNSAQV